MLMLLFIRSIIMNMLYTNKHSNEFCSFTFWTQTTNSKGCPGQTQGATERPLPWLGMPQGRLVTCEAAGLQPPWTRTPHWLSLAPQASCHASMAFLSVTAAVQAPLEVPQTKTGRALLACFPSSVSLLSQSPPWWPLQIPGWWVTRGLLTPLQLPGLL